MSDPFAQFMDIWAPSVGIEEAFKSYQLKEAQNQAAYIVPDIAPFRDTSGAYISGRVAWREHLKRTGTIELGHADLQKQAERQTAQYQARREKFDRAAKVAPVTPISEARPVAPSATRARVLERLHGRPAPDRPTLIKIAMEERMRK